MNPDQLDLARRLAAHPRFEWRRGMAALFEPAPFCDGSLRIEEDGWMPTWCDDIARPSGWPDAKRAAWPDLTDAATGGVLLDMLGPGWVTERTAATDWGRDMTFVRRMASVKREFAGDTLAEACARALLAGWGEG